MPTDKTPLYQEALVEVKKLRELAKKEAEKSILEKFSPIVDQIINKEMSGAPVIFEQEEDPTAVQSTQPPVTQPVMPNPGAAAAAPPMPATAPMDTNVTPPAGDMGTSSLPAMDMPPVGDPTAPALPASVAPVTNGSSLAIPVPGPDGKITVDIEALFSATPEGSEPNFAAAAITPAPGAEPALPAVPPTPAPAGEGEALLAAGLGGEPKTETPPVPEMEPEALPAVPAPTPVPLAEVFQESLNSLNSEILLETSSKKMSDIQKEFLQSKIFALYEMAQKAKTSKVISKALIANAEVLMELMFAKLKESAKQVNSYNRQTTIKEELKMSKKDFNTLKEFAASLFAEEVEAKGHAGFGDGDATKAGVTNTTTLKDETPKKKSGDAGGVKDPGKEASLKVGGAAVAEAAEDDDSEVMDEAATLESELMEMLSGMEEEGMTAMSTPEEEGAMPVMESSEEEEGVVKKESLTRKLKALKEEEAKLVKALKECGMGGAPVSEPANVNIRISVEGGEVEDVDTGAGSEGDEDMIEIVPDHEESEEEEGMLGSSEEESAPEEGEEEEEVPMVAESKVSKENKKLRSQLAETQLLTARSLFVSKLFAEHNLSVGTKQKIVEYIDSAQTVEEAKTKYGRVKKMLEESTKPLRKIGSSSRPSVSAAPVLTESANPLMKLEMNPNRWMHLAGITKKSV